MGLVETAVGLAYALLDDGALDAAIAIFTAAPEHTSDAFPALRGRGSAYVRAGRYDAAIIDLKEAIRLDASDAATFSCRGTANAAIGDYNKAIADQTEAIRLNPNDANAYCQRRHANCAKGEWQPARACSCARDVEGAAAVPPRVVCLAGRHPSCFLPAPGAIITDVPSLFGKLHLEGVVLGRRFSPDRKS